MINQAAKTASAVGNATQAIIEDGANKFKAGFEEGFVKENPEAAAEIIVQEKKFESDLHKATEDAAHKVEKFTEEVNNAIAHGNPTHHAEASALFRKYFML
uniref:DUF148 domain-containing protein n=1 Tax=Rhabditophanes sp. KR3021 TaxID=114890 RepID=A0AC35TL97_9BILA